MQYGGTSRLNKTSPSISPYQSPIKAREKAVEYYQNQVLGVLRRDGNESSESGFSKPSLMNDKYSSPKKKKSRVDKLELKKQEYESFKNKIREFNPPTVLVDSNDIDKSSSTKLENSEEVALIHHHEKEGILDKGNQKLLADGSNKESQPEGLQRIKEEKKTKDKEYSGPENTNKASASAIIEKESFEMMKEDEPDSLDLSNNQEEKLSMNTTEMIMSDEAPNDFESRIETLQKNYHNEVKQREQAEDNERKLRLELKHICEENKKELADLREFISNELQKLKTKEQCREHEWETRFQQETKRYEDLKEKLERMEENVRTKVVEEGILGDSSCYSIKDDKLVDRCNTKRDHENCAKEDLKRSYVSLDASKVPNGRCSIM